MRRFVRVVAVLVLLVALGFVGWRLHRLLPSNYEKQMPLYVPGIASTQAAATTDHVLPNGCEAQPTPLVGTSASIQGHDGTMPMLSLGLDPEGAPATPPGNDGYTLAWYDQGPAVGSNAGHVVLTAHTFRYGGALGNDLNDGMLKTGAIFRISDDAGHTVCYRFSHALKVRVADYDPHSDVLYDTTGDPQLVLVVCADYPLTGGEPQARALYYSDLVRAG